MNLIDFILHVDQHLADFARDYGAWIYGILFTIVFVETGLVIMPFLPGDSLLFAAGALSAKGLMNPFILGGLLITAAVTGDTLNYHIGKYIGPRVFEMDSPWIRKDYLIKTHDFFEKHGGKTIIFARFIPFARTFAPFIAGVSQMTFRHFIFYSVFGAVCWVSSFLFLGHTFGNLPYVKDNFTYLVFGIIFISIAPAIYGFIKQKMSKNQ